MSADIKKAARAAGDLLRKYHYDKPPIDPEWIAEQEGLRVLYASFEHPDSDKVSGFFRLEDKTIIINNDIFENRITFTIAHELAHFVLHKDYIKSQNYIPMPRNNEYDGVKPIEEVEADQFAANLLVPLHMLRSYSDIASVGELARLFFVSDEVIRYRLDLLRRFPRLAAARNDYA